MIKTFDEVFVDKTKLGTKIKTDEYHEKGDNIIVDQGQKLVAGYTDLKDGIFDEVPVILFGDHTRVVKYIEEPFFLGADGVKVLRSKLDNANYKYLYYALRNVNIPDTGYNRHFKWLKEICIRYPELEEQEKIVTILDKVSYIIEDRKKELEKLDELIKARFVELFGLPGVDEFGWRLVTLGSACCINPKKGQDIRLNSGVEVSFVPMTAVTEHGEIDATDIREYDEVKTGFTYFAENDVLFAKITPCMENGKGAVAKGLHNGIGFGSTEFHVLRPINGVTNPYWLYTLTSFPQFRADAANNMTGSAGQRRVPTTFLEHYRVSVPPIELQNQFSAFVEQTDKSKVIVQKSEKQIETLKSIDAGIFGLILQQKQNFCV